MLWRKVFSTISSLFANINSWRIRYFFSSYRRNWLVLDSDQREWRGVAQHYCHIPIHKWYFSYVDAIIQICATLSLPAVVFRIKMIPMGQSVEVEWWQLDKRMQVTLVAPCWTSIMETPWYDPATTFFRPTFKLSPFLACCRPSEAFNKAFQSKKSWLMILKFMHKSVESAVNIWNWPPTHHYKWQLASLIYSQS